MARDDTVGTVYLLHFSRPLAHAQHYVGWAIDAHARIDHHLAGNGSKLVAAALRAGIHVDVVRTWHNVDRAFERQLKKNGTLKRVCPCCRSSYNRRARNNMRRYRAAKRKDAS